jgi:hypothetical protein
MERKIMKNRNESYGENNGSSYERRNNFEPRRNGDDAHKKRSHFLLPPPAILEAYEQLRPKIDDLSKQYRNYD